MFTKTKHKRRQQTGFAKRWGRAKPPKLPELVRPDGAGYMPLYCAAHWIATRGGTLAFNPLREAIWRKAWKDDLRDRIVSGDVRLSESGRTEFLKISEAFILHSARSTIHSQSDAILAMNFASLCIPPLLSMTNIGGVVSTIAWKTGEACGGDA